MKQLSRVLAAIDFSKPADGAFDYALALSERQRAELVVVHAVPPREPFDRRATERLELASLRERARRAGVEFRAEVGHGAPAETILLHARTLRPDVIVAAAPQRRGLGRLRRRSVAARLVAEAPVPVLLVPPRRHRSSLRPFGHLAIAVDFSRSSERALEHAFTLASGPTVAVTLIHVVPGFSAGASPHLYRYGLTEYQLALVRDARRRLERAIPAERRTQDAIQSLVLVGDATTELRDVVDRIGADLLVVGVPKRGAVSRALFRTTAARLLGTTRVPVLAVPEAGTAAVREERASVQLAA